METINATIFAGESFEVIEEGHLVIEKGKIAEVNDGYVREGLDYKDYLIMPSLVNSHTHLGDSFAKEGVLGLTTEEAVGPQGKKWQYYKNATKEEIKKAMRDSLIYMLDSGITTFVDFREGGGEGVKLIKEALQDVPINGCILGREIELNEADGLGLNTHELEQIPEERGGKIIAIHAGEEKGEIKMTLEKNPDIIVHFTKGTEKEIELVAERGIHIVICPRANAVLGVGIPPGRELLDMGVNVSLGTDNIMINSPNLFREMEFLSKLSYLREPVTPREILKMVTLNPSKMLKMNSGTIEKGKNADLIFIDKKAKNLRNNKEFLATIVHRCEPENVRKVMIKGKEVINKEK